MKKKILAVILCLTFVMSAFSAIAIFADEAADTPAPVEGFTQDDEKKELRASTPAGLMEVAATVNKGGYSDYNIFIDADIDMTGYDWKPIAAASGNAFRGVLDGQGHTIKAITVQDYAQAFGFVGYAISGGAIKNLHLEGINATATKAYCGALVGRLHGGDELGAEFVIENCTTQGALSTTANYAGGLVGALHNGNPQTVVAEDGTESEIYYPPCLRVENCAVNMTLSAAVNYAAGIIAGDSFTQDGKAPAGASPKITCNNVFVTGSYSSPGKQASGFIGYCNLATLIVENCFSAAEIDGADDVSGSFFTRTRKSQITVRNCYSISSRPFSGELECFGNMTDADGNVIDGMNIINSYALKVTGVDAEGNPTAELVDPKVCVKFTYKGKPAAPEAGADAETVKKYEDALKFYNEYPVVTINAVNYTIEDIVNIGEAEGAGETISNVDVKLTVPSLPEQELLHLADEVAATLFAADSKQAALVEAYMIARKCPHTETAEVVDGVYLAANATCTAKATYYKSCVACKMALKDLETFESGEMAPHNWAERWGADETNHFHACTVCREATTEVAAHTFGEWEVDKEATVEKEGKKIRSCSVCQYEEEEAIPKLDPPPVDENGGDDAGEGEKEGGCGGAIGGASIIIMLAAAGAVVARKKED